MKAIIAAGGTGGHINPAIAIADEIKKNEPDSQIVFVGRDDGMEKTSVGKAGYEFYPMETHGFSRSFKPSEIWFNIKSVYFSAAGIIKTAGLIRKMNPDIVIGCGGYVSGPVVMSGALLGKKTAIQEQNSFPGVTTKILSRRVSRIFAPSKEAAERLGLPEKTIITGNPIRDGFANADRDKAREKLGVGDRVCILSFGGSLGASTINKLSAVLASKHYDSGKILQIHSTGPYGKESFPVILAEAGVPADCDNVRVQEYIYDMQDCLAAADIVISRAGAISLSEITASGTASVLIPSPNVTENHQYFNAMSVVNAGGALIYEEKDIDYDKAADEILKLAYDSDKLHEMGNNAKSVSHPDATAQIYKHIRELVYNG